MLAPLSWLKDYIDIKMSSKELGDRLTEVGLGTEKITKSDNDVIFELEITPNRPDLLSIMGIAREIAAIEEKNIKFPKLKTNLKPKKEIKILPLTIQTDNEINPRFTAIIINGVKVKESPLWLKERLIKIGQRPINNIVDITNYVMFELGNPIHAFDYDKIKGHTLRVHKAKGGEEFKSVDGISYSLPKDAVVISDNEKIIDLCGIKGGYNSGTFTETKTIVIRVPVENPILIRKTSQHLGLRSDASSIFERGVNKGGTIDALKRTVDLIQELSGGEIASNLYDIKHESFNPWKLKLRLERLNKILGIIIPKQKVLQILESLNLSPVVKNGVVETTIPTYRNDLKIEEDLIEEVARLYGYNNFPKTLPIGEIPMQQIPYFKNYRFDEKVKSILTSANYSEIYSYSLVSETDLASYNINPEKVLRVDNPVSREFEYLRPQLKINLEKALHQNQAISKEVNLFELGKVYIGENLSKTNDKYHLAGISNTQSFYEVKGLLEKLFKEIAIEEDPTPNIEILENGVYFEMDFSKILEVPKETKKYTPIPKFPPFVEDLAIITKTEVKTGDIIKEIKKQSPLIVAVDLLDQYENTRTFHIVYQHREKNLTGEEIREIRGKLLRTLSEKFEAEFK